MLAYRNLETKKKVQGKYFVGNKDTERATSQSIDLSTRQLISRTTNIGTYVKTPPSILKRTEQGI